MKGFWISNIIAKGENKTDASIKLKRGANIIYGPSDTGKSYLFSVINYVLGRSTAPNKDIPEGEGYDTFLLRIVTFDNEDNYLLERTFDSMKVKVWKYEEEEKLVAVDTFTSSGILSNKKHISNFLLKLCGLEDKVLLKSKTKGTKINLSFKNIIQLTNIAEERIITKNSPFYFTEINQNHTLEQSMISTILGDEDFSKVKTIQDKKIKETRISGKLEFIDTQILRYSNKRIQLLEKLKAIAKNKNNINLEIYNEQLKEKISTSYKLKEKISDYHFSVNSLIERKIYYQELIKRFNILERQYLSDLDRLEFILEAESLTTQLPSKLCPICSKPMQEDEVSHLIEIESFREGVIFENKLISDKLADLQQSINDCQSNLKKIKGEEIKNENILTNLSKELDFLSPQIKELQNIVDDILKSEKISIELSFIDSETKSFYSEKNRLEKAQSQKETSDIVNVCDYELLNNLCRYIEKRLKKWNYDLNPKVIFDSGFKVFDINISGKSRNSYGKGRRAISYTACILGFLDLCLVEKRSFSNLIILDSPITSFKDKKDPTETLEEVMKVENLFFKDLKNTSKECQIIIFENKEPIETKKLNIIEFTKSLITGRFGFYPVNKNK